jgi:hypothetical protein
MSDPSVNDGLLEAGKLLGAVGGGGGLVAFLSRLIQSRESQAVATELALLRRDVEQLNQKLASRERDGERLALLEAR